MSFPSFLPRSQTDWSAHFHQALRRFSEGIVLTLFLALFVRWLVVEVSIVADSSMAPQIIEGDFVWVWKLPYQVSSRPAVELDSLVLIEASSEIYRVGWVQGLEGDRIALIKGQLYRNGARASTAYFPSLSEQTVAPIVIPPDHVLVLSARPSVDLESQLYTLKSFIGRIFAKGPHLRWPRGSWWPILNWDFQFISA